MEHDLKRYPRLLAKLLTGSPLPLDCSVQGCISVWDSTHLGRKPSHRLPHTRMLQRNAPPMRSNWVPF